MAMAAIIMLLAGYGVMSLFGQSYGVVKFQADGGSTTIITEIADSQQKWETGLMYRDNLPSDRGMLFLFPSLFPRAFTMENTHIPLDIIFISGDGTILDIYPSAQPESRMLYTSPCFYAVEVNGGFCKEQGIRVGDKVKIGLYRHPARY